MIDCNLDTSDVDVKLVGENLVIGILILFECSLKSLDLRICEDSSDSPLPNSQTRGVVLDYHFIHFSFHVGDLYNFDGLMGKLLKGIGGRST